MTFFPIHIGKFKESIWKERNLFIWAVLLSLWGCMGEAEDQFDINYQTCSGELEDRHDSLPQIRGALVTTRFDSYKALEEVIQIRYGSTYTDRDGQQKASWVELTHCSGRSEVRAMLGEGVSEQDFSDARDKGLSEKLSLLVLSPFSVRNRQDLQRVSLLARRKPDLFGEGDAAFYDLSEAIMCHIPEEEKVRHSELDLLSEKGYFNTVNHIIAQAFMTTLFSEKVADLVGDAHERKTLPALIHGNFTEAQLNDMANGPVDNYIDMLNNQWGQELGKELKRYFGINRETVWTANLLANYLNELQAYFSWAFQIGFSPFRPEDVIVQKFSLKMQEVLPDAYFKGSM